MINNASPVIFIHDTRGLLVKNYIFNNTLTTENFEYFLKRWESNSKEERFLRSSEVRNEDNQNVNEISGKRLREIVFEKQKNVLILFYDPYCRNCSKFYKIFEEVSIKYKADFNTIFLKINMMKNDIDFIEIDKLPLIIVNPIIGSIKVYDKDITSNSLSEFVEECLYKTEL